MKLVSRTDVLSLMKYRSDPALSFYVPGRAPGEDARLTVTRMKNLFHSAEHTLHDNGRKPVQIQELLAPLAAWIDDASGRDFQDKGVAAFVSDDSTTLYAVPHATEESVTVSDRFCIRPLIPLLAGNGPFHVLALSLNDVRLFDCNRDGCRQHDVDGFPESLQEILDTYDGQKQLQHMHASGKGNVFHGFDSFKDSEKGRITEYVRQVDTTVVHTLADSTNPLILVCVDYLFPLYKSVSKYPALADRHVSGSPDSLPLDRMQAMAWDLVRGVLDEDRDAALDALHSAAGTGRTADGLKAILPAARDGRVAILLLDESTKPFGHWDDETGLAEPDSDTGRCRDLFDLAAHMVLEHGGTVYMTDPETLPAGVDSQALLRY